MQVIFIQGRPLEITDEGVCPKGKFLLLFVDWQDLWKTSRDELKFLENKRLTLEVQFYNEVKKWPYIMRS